MTGIADLHIHTTASDGSFSPREVVDLARKSGFRAISITDHDTIEGVDEAVNYGKETGVEVIPGIELSTAILEQGLHILGYYIDYKDPWFNKQIEYMMETRIKRIQAMVEKLNQQGIMIEYGRVRVIGKSGSIGKSHIAIALKEKNYVDTVDQAFKKYIGKDHPAYVERDKLTSEQAIKLILRAGGIPVIAHPCSQDFADIILSLKSAGLAGIEAYYTEHTQEITDFYIGFAEKHNMLITGGSDCHGHNKSSILLGRVKLPYKYVEKLTQAWRYRQNI